MTYLNSYVQICRYLPQSRLDNTMTCELGNTVGLYVFFSYILKHVKKQKQKQMRLILGFGLHYVGVVGRGCMQHLERYA